MYDTFGKVTPLADEEDDVYKTIIKPTIGSKIMLLSGSSTITNINIYDGEKNLIKTLENNNKNENGIYTESISLEAMEAEKDFYYVEMKFDKYSYYKNVYYLTKPTESEIASLEKNTSVDVETSETSMSWYKFQASEEDKYTLSSGNSAFIFDFEFKYQKMPSNTTITIQLNANDIIYIGIINTSTSNSNLIIKDSFAASKTMSEGTYTRTVAYNDVYGILDTATRKHRWAFTAADTTLTIMDEDKNVLTSYTSTGTNDKFTYEITAGTKCYVRIKSSVGVNYTYEKALDVNAYSSTDYSNVHIINSDNWKIHTTNLFLGSNTLYKFNIPESGTYRFYAANTNARDFSKYYDYKNYYCENFYIIDEDNFKNIRIIAEYNSTTKQGTYMDVELKKVLLLYLKQVILKKQFGL